MLRVKVKVLGSFFIFLFVINELREGIADIEGKLAHPDQDCFMLFVTKEMKICIPYISFGSFED